MNQVSRVVHRTVPYVAWGWADEHQLISMSHDSGRGATSKTVK
jgi:hypothetical protein